MGAHEGTFLARLAGFCAHLRDCGLPVGVGGELDLARALADVGVTDREAFRNACRATLAKSSGELDLLDQAFDHYWFGTHAKSPEAPQPAVPPSPPADGVPRPSSDRPPPMIIDAAGAISFGVYSPDAPPGAHSLGPLPPGRLEALRTGARRFRRHAATRPGRRTVASRRGKIDLGRTARRGLGHGGEWIELRRRKRKSLRADLFVLWDVSGSMREHDRELFALAYAMHRVSRRCRVFAFGSHLEELTSRLQSKPYARAGLAVAPSLPGTGGGTRIGRCLREFRLRFGASVTAKSTVVVLSDGWDLGDGPPLAQELSWLRRRAHLVAWINPYARRPDFRPETAGMLAAISHVDLLLAPEDFEARKPRHWA